MTLETAYAKLNAQIQALRARQDRMKASRRPAEIKRIVQLMREYAITPQALAAEYRVRHPDGKRPQSATPSSAPRKRVASKYRHPETGESWSGRGKPARWLLEAERSGVKRERFLIAPAALHAE